MVMKIALQAMQEDALREVQEIYARAYEDAPADLQARCFFIMSNLHTHDRISCSSNTARMTTLAL